LAGYSGGLSGRLWPGHCQPAVDELLSSWLTRLSLAHGLDVRTLGAVLRPGKGIGSGDIDRCVHPTILAGLAEKTATSINQVWAMTLNAYAGRLFVELKSNTTRWLLMNAMQGHRRQLNALQFCPQCVRSDPSPYFRRHWRLGFVTVCGRHRRRLLDCCPLCQEPVNYQCLDRQAHSITCCHQCGFDLRRAPAPTLDDTPLNQCLILWQQDLLDAVKTGGYTFSSATATPLDYLRVLHQLAQLLLTRRHADYWRDRLCYRLGLAAFDPGFVASKPRIVEALSVYDRFQLMRLLAWWLNDWPERFITVCFDILIWSGDLLARMSAPPPWYESIVQQVNCSNALNRVVKLVEAEIAAGNLTPNTFYQTAPLESESLVPSH
jgi:hypothetical protein